MQSITSHKKGKNYIYAVHHKYSSLVTYDINGEYHKARVSNKEIKRIIKELKETMYA